MIQHADGSVTVLQVVPASSVFGSDVHDRWVVVPPDGFRERPGDMLVTDIPEDLYVWSLPIGNVLPGIGFTCPRCGRTSHHPTDKQEGYCGACHDWTRDAP